MRIHSNDRCRKPIKQFADALGVTLKKIKRARLCGWKPIIEYKVGDQIVLASTGKKTRIIAAGDSLSYLLAQDMRPSARAACGLNAMCYDYTASDKRLIAAIERKYAFTYTVDYDTGTYKFPIINRSTFDYALAKLGAVVYLNSKPRSVKAMRCSIRDLVHNHVVHIHVAGPNTPAHARPPAATRYGCLYERAARKRTHSIILANHPDAAIKRLTQLTNRLAKLKYKARRKP